MASTTILVHVIDYNEYEPQFAQDSYNFEAERKQGLTIGHVNVTSTFVYLTSVVCMYAAN